MNWIELDFVNRIGIYLKMFKNTRFSKKCFS